MLIALYIGEVIKMKNLNEKSFINNRVLNNLKSNDTCEYFLYFQNKLNYEKNCYSKKVILYNKDLKEEKILDIPFEVEDYVFNQQNIILKAIENNTTNLYSYDLDTEKIKKISTIPFKLKKFIIINDYIYFSTEIQNSSIDAPYKCSINSPFFIEGKGLKGERLTSLFKSSIDGKNITLLSTLDLTVERIDFDLDNNRIVFSAKKVLKFQQLSSEVYMYDLEKDELKLLLSENFRIGNILSFNEQIVLIWAIDLTEKSRNENQELFIIDCVSRGIQNYGFGSDFSNEHPGIITDAFFYNGKIMKKYNNRVYIKLIGRNDEMLYEIDLTGAVKEIPLETTMINEYIISDNGVYYIGVKNQQLQELYFNNKQLTNHNKWLEDYKIVQPEKINFRIGDLDYDGWVILPVDYKTGEKYPGVLFIHGGPKMMYTSVFSFDMQLLSAKGYYVFYMNPRGSDGRGDDYSNIRGNFGKRPYDELMKFTSDVLNLYPAIDPNRLGVTGGSYGGYMTNYIITHTNKFQAAVSERGISNLMTAFTSSDIGHEYIYEYMGNHDTPWNNKKKYIENSPIYQVDRVKTPTLFIHGEKDYRCNYTESLNMFNALNYHGVPTKFCLFTDESHSLVVKGRPNNKYKRYKELVNWFNMHLKRR
jgi:cephalosporin-C deacetylase-like acetyl esterase